jgi:hypothetical protein
MFNTTTTNQAYLYLVRHAYEQELIMHKLCSKCTNRIKCTVGCKEYDTYKNFMRIMTFPCVYDKNRHGVITLSFTNNNKKVYYYIADRSHFQFYKNSWCYYSEQVSCPAVIQRLERIVKNYEGLK